MPSLEIRLLGPAEVTRGGQRVTGLGTVGLGLFAYLAIEADRAHSRDALAGLLWPEQPNQNARHSLRQALTTLRRAIGDDAAAPPRLLLTRESVIWWAITTWGQRRREMPEVLARPQWAHLAVYRVRTPAQAEALLADLSRARGGP